MNTTEISSLQTQIKRWMVLFIIGLVLSGVTAFPLETELSATYSLLQSMGWDNPISHWVEKVYVAVKDTNAHYPFLAYGTDWLAFAHVVIAIAFIGPLRDPVRNVWVIEFGMISCVAVFPLAFIAGPIRGIPLYWQLIDCSFGVFGGLLLWRIHRKIKKLETYTCSN